MLYIYIYIRVQTCARVYDLYRTLAVLGTAKGIRIIYRIPLDACIRLTRFHIFICSERDAWQGIRYRNGPRRCDVSSKTVGGKGWEKRKKNRKIVTSEHIPTARRRCFANISQGFLSEGTLGLRLTTTTSEHTVRRRPRRMSYDVNIVSIRVHICDRRRIQ